MDSYFVYGKDAEKDEFEIITSSNSLPDMVGNLIAAQQLEKELLPKLPFCTYGVVSFWALMINGFTVFSSDGQELPPPKLPQNFPYFFQLT